MLRWKTLAGWLMLGLLPAVGAWPEPLDPWNVFALDGAKNIMDEEHFGVVNGHITAGVNYKDVASLGGLWAPPYVSSDFTLNMRFFGETVPSAHYTWRPMEVEREGHARDIAIKSVFTLIQGQRAGLLTLHLKNEGTAPVDLPLECSNGASLDTTDTWEFGRPESHSAAPPTASSRRIVRTQGDCTLELRTDAQEAQWDAAQGGWRMTIPLAAGGSRVLQVAFALGRAAEVAAALDAVVNDPEGIAGSARAAYRAGVEDLFSKLPRLESDNKALEAFYNRSLVHFLTNRWEVPEFVRHPYFGTGSVKGGCVCNYLWNFGETWELLPLYDPGACREHIKQFLRVDITTHFAFIPTTGAAFGPWYPVNQEKILGLIYFYVMNTGDAAFLNDEVNGRSVLDWVLYNATLRDDPAKPVALIDYGPSNSHLELRRGFPYNHVMPDLNGRRYMSYLWAAALAEAAGRPAPELRARAEDLKVVLKKELWDPQAKWFRFRDENGKDDLRYTMQIFKLFASPVLDAEEESGLLSHLNETEFLSDFGFHSMSKTDIAYDQVDIDNGGGGSCTSFPPQIAERLYKCGHAPEADDILRRMLWSGERMPYWGDSLVANSMDYRRDTPLQCTFDGVAAAQCILFGMMGVEAHLDGSVTLRPHLPGFAKQVRLLGIRIRGIVFDLALDDTGFELTRGQETRHYPRGAAARLDALAARP